MSELINRQDAIKLIVETPSKIQESKSDVAMFGAAYREHEIIDIIKGLPDQSKGHWIVSGKKQGVYDIKGIMTWGVSIKCNKCGFTHTAVQGHVSQYKFCPSCGVDMRHGGGKA